MQVIIDVMIGLKLFSGTGIRCILSMLLDMLNEELNSSFLFIAILLQGK